MRHTWIVNPDPVIFPEGKTWRDYVNENRLEITCGEAPYLVSRYDTVTGEPIPLHPRIGLLDRKLRIVGENTTTSGEWLKAAQSAFQSTDKSRPSKGHRYSLSANVETTFPEILFDEQSSSNDRIQIYGRYGNQRGYKWIKSTYISKPDNFEFFKVIVPEANGTGAISEVLSTPVIGHTDTFLSIGKFASAQEASACLKYVQTKLPGVY